MFIIIIILSDYLKPAASPSLPSVWGEVEESVETLQVHRRHPGVMTNDTSAKFISEQYSNHMYDLGKHRFISFRLHKIDWNCKKRDNMNLSTQRGREQASVSHYFSKFSETVRWSKKWVCLTLFIAVCTDVDIFSWKH